MTEREKVLSLMVTAENAATANCCFRNIVEWVYFGNATLVLRTKGRCLFQE